MLQVLNKVHLLKMGGELGLISAVLEDGRFHLRQYGHLVSNALKANKKGNLFMACLFASNYWRIVGKPSEAIECQKKALHLAPNVWKFSALLSMANVLHRTHYSEDAVTILHKAIEITPDNPALHFTLGNIQATLLKFNESAESFDMALKLQPSFEAAARRRHAVVCHQKLEQTLEQQQHALQETLMELRHYKKQHDRWTQLLNKIVHEQASFETRMQTTIGYEHSKMKLQMSENEKRRRWKLDQSSGSIGDSKWKVNHRGSCVQSVDEGGNIRLTCSVLPSDGADQLEEQLLAFKDPKFEDKNESLRSFKTNENHHDSNDVDLLLRRFESRIQEINGGSEINRDNKNIDRAKEKYSKTKSYLTKRLDKETSLIDDYDIRPTLPEKYPTFHNSNQMFGPDWPTKEICKEHNLEKEWNDYPTVFLSPENKGFE